MQTRSITSTLSAALVALASITFLMGASQCEGAAGDSTSADASADADVGAFPNPSGGEGGAGGDDTCEAAGVFPTLVADPANAAYPDPFVDAYCDGDTLVVESNGIPDYPFVPLTPNGLSAQSYVWEIPLSPEIAAAPTEIPLLGLAAFALNGLPIYGPNEAQFPDPYGDPVYNAIVDDCLGHTGGNADYHYHALVVACVLDSLGYREGEPSPIIGLAMDGFPIYGSWGCLDADCEDVVEFRSGYQQIGDPTTYAWDAHEYVASSDPTVLDECNGRIGPDGTYRYHATDSFPYVLGCYRGTPTSSAGGGQPTGGGDPTGGGGGGTVLPTCDQVPAGRGCCGDGICDGPETAANCGQDC